MKMQGLFFIYNTFNSLHNVLRFTVRMPHKKIWLKKSLSLWEIQDGEF